MAQLTSSQSQGVMLMQISVTTVRPSTVANHGRRSVPSHVLGRRGRGSSDPGHHEQRHQVHSGSPSGVHQGRHHQHSCLPGGSGRCRHVRPPPSRMPPHNETHGPVIIANSQGVHLL
ncbi:unnamed protein product [Closterium sp. Yama58-4]|nr:unnamed protein product [Closterium sp. Yama58-4]